MRTTFALSRASGVLTRRQRFRAVVASTIGTTIEWYDTILFGLAVPLYIGPLFFPSRDPFSSALAGFSTLLASFAARPIGAALFGHYGDKVGRKATLVATLLAGGVASCLVGLVPTYAEIGVFAPILLVLLRVVIGASLGGEWGGSVLLSMEWSNQGRRGYWASWPQIGVPAATVLGFAALQGSLWLLGPSSYWAWRLPFLASIILVAIGLYVRLGVLETPTFSHLLESRRIARRPVLTVLRRNPREVLLTCLLRLGEQTPAMIFSTFFLVYATATLHLTFAAVIQVSLLASLVGLGATPLFGYVSDLVGRRRMFLTGVACMAVFALPYWSLLNTRDVGLVLLAAVLAQVIVAMMTGPQAAFIAEAFTGSLRYSGASIGAGLGAVISGGLASLIAIKLFQTFHSPAPIGIYIIVCSALSFAAALALRERSRADVSVEYDDEDQAAGALSQPAGA
jgi:MFS family permease